MFCNLDELITSLLWFLFVCLFVLFLGVFFFFFFFLVLLVCLGCFFYITS